MRFPFLVDKYLENVLKWQFLMEFEYLIERRYIRCVTFHYLYYIYDPCSRLIISYREMNFLGKR